MKRRRKKVYDEKVIKELKRIWYIMDFSCGKRLTASIKWLIPKLEKHNELNIDEKTKEKLLMISPPNLDRILKPERKKVELKPRSKTKPGTLLKHQIPIRTFSEWDEKIPGFVEINLVSHDGGNGNGDFIYTLDVTDVASSWTETEAVKNRAQVWIFSAIDRIRKRVPFIF